MPLSTPMPDKQQIETVLEAAVRRQLERISEAERQRRPINRRADRLWQTRIKPEV